MADPLSSEEDLLPSIRQLISSIKPTLRAAESQATAEDMVNHLEETDDNFHRYELVKYIRSRIEEVLGPLIEEEIEHRSLDMQSKGGEEDMVRMITDHVINDQACLDLLSSLKHCTRDAVDRLVKIFDEEHHVVQKSMFGGMPGGYGPTAMHSPKRNSFCFSDDSSSFDSSFNQGSFTFMSQEHFANIVDNLLPDKPLEIRRETLQALCKLPPSDILACDQWDSLRAVLLIALSDPDEVLAEMSLHFHAKMFSSNSHHVMREVYTSLIEHLIAEFVHEGASTLDLQDGVNMMHPIAGNILRKFRLMNEFNLEIPIYWVRFPDRFLDDVTELTTSLLVTQAASASSSIEPVTPLHFMAIVDPKANWFRKWMHGNYGRTAVIRHLGRNRSLVETCVQQCVNYVSSMDRSVDLVDHVTQKLSKQSLGSSHRTEYTKEEVNYLFLHHSISLLGCLLMYVDGHKLFPIDVKDGNVNVTELLVSFVLIIIGQDEVAARQGQCSLDLASLVTDVLKMLCFTKSSCFMSLCRDAIVAELLKPIRMWLTRKQACSDTKMLHIADILSTMASWEVGRKLLLYGEKVNWSKENSSAPIHTVAEFTRFALDSTLSTSLSLQPSRSVAGAFLHVCRQLYSTCEGLLVLSRYGLHHHIANCWRQVCRELEMTGTPMPRESKVGYGEETESADGAGQSQTHEADALQAWEHTLIDNLLNFASTPKGLYLLQQTGAINECIAYMYNRSARKLQVSKTEKFGYGSMVTQFAATAPGIVALQKTGFIQAVVHGLWSVLECGCNGQPMFRPSPIPVEPIDRMAHKFFIRMMNILSAFPAVYEILAGKTLPRKDSYSLREGPSDILGMMERLIVVDTDAKINSLFHYEQSHVFGLRLLNVLTSCLDSLLLLETQYRLGDMLLQGQESSRKGESTIMIDALSIERNHLLVRTNVIGGPKERVLPPHGLQTESGNPYPWPLFSALPVPKEYAPNVPRAPSTKPDGDLTKLLSSSMPVKTASEAHLWLAKCQAAFLSCLAKKSHTISNRVLADMLDQTISAQLLIPENEVFPKKPCKVSDSALKSQKLSNLHMLGVKMTVRYGQHLRLLSSGSDSAESLGQLLKTCRYYLNSQQRSIHSNMRCLEGDYIGHDWFVSSIFLLQTGHREKAWSFLHKCFSILPSGYLSMARLHASVHIPYDTAASGIHPVFSRTSHNVELILQTEVPHVYSAFRMSGYTPSQICQQWLRQCFWNYLDWADISHYIALCIIMGADYQVYMCVAILKFLQHWILLYTQKNELQEFLKENSIDGFHVGQHVDFMQSLERKYRSTVLPDMSNLTPT